MADYYSILGLTKEASATEIKKAFRQLAKIYHPDKNPNDPNAKVLFENILKAYNILINPNSKKRYDDRQSSSNSYKPNYNYSTKHKSSQREKNYTDEELRQRDYYKNYYKSKQEKIKKNPPTTTYSDYKYILFATPLAVGLLMFIISMFTEEPKVIPVKQEKNNQENIIPENNLTNGNTPYTNYFGPAKTYNTNNTLKINNTSGFDVIVVVFENKSDEYIQHSYLQANYYAEFSFLPDSGVYCKYVLGEKWNAEKLLFNEIIQGCFDSIVQYQNWRTNPILFNSKKNTVNASVNIENDQYISNEFDFFEKPAHNEYD